jgi:hypothetical protein
MQQRRNTPINILRCVVAWRYFYKMRLRKICLRAVVYAGAPLLFSLAPASAQLLGIPQINVPLPPLGEAPDPGPVEVLERPRFVGYGDFVQYVNNSQLYNVNGGASLGTQEHLRAF